MKTLVTSLAIVLLCASCAANSSNKKEASNRTLNDVYAQDYTEEALRNYNNTIEETDYYHFR